MLDQNVSEMIRHSLKRKEKKVCSYTILLTVSCKTLSDDRSTNPIFLLQLFSSACTSVTHDGLPEDTFGGPIIMCTFINTNIRSRPPEENAFRDNKRLLR